MAASATQQQENLITLDDWNELEAMLRKNPKPKFEVNNDISFSVERDGNKIHIIRSSYHEACGHGDFLLTRYTIENDETSLKSYTQAGDNGGNIDGPDWFGEIGEDTPAVAAALRQVQILYHEGVARSLRSKAAS